MFTLSPTGLVIQYEQMTTTGFIGREPSKVTVAQNLPGELFNAGAPGRYDLSALSGDAGTIDGIFETGTAGTARTILYLRGNPEFPNAYIKVWVDTSNRLIARVTDALGAVVATSQVATSPMIAGQLVHFRLAWNCAGLLPVSLQSNYGAAFIDVLGTHPDWTIVSSTWTAWKPDLMFIGGEPGSPTGFNGVIRRIAVSPLNDPSAEDISSSSVVHSTPVVYTAQIAHAGNLTVSGLYMASVPPHSLTVILTGTGAVTLTQSQITAAGGTIGTTIVIPASLVPGIDGTTSCAITSNSLSSNTVVCALPTDVPTVTSATIGFDSGLLIVGTYLLSRGSYPNVASIAGPGAASRTRAAVLAAGGTWTDTSISIPASLTTGINNTSTVAITANLQSTSAHAIVWPAAAPTITSANIAHLGQLTIIGTGMLSTAPASNSVIITGTGAVTVTAAQITGGGGTVTATSIVVPAALVPGINGSSNAKVHANLQDSGVQACALPSDAPTVTTAAIQPVSLDLVVNGTNFLSRTPSISSIDITAPGAVNLTKSAVETGGGTWSDTQISIPGALIVGINNTSTCAVTANAVATAYSAITGP